MPAWCAVLNGCCLQYQVRSSKMAEEVVISCFSWNKCSSLVYSYRVELFSARGESGLCAGCCAQAAAAARSSRPEEVNLRLRAAAVNA
eukprot:62774-Pleurochrysis_carterae.AAC.2